MIYEFECPRCRHVTEARVPMDTAKYPCERCSPRPPAGRGRVTYAKRILSPTPTTFKFADRRNP